MTTDQRAALDAMMRQLPLDLGGDLAEQRALLVRLMTAHPLPADVSTAPAVLGGVPVEHVTVDGSAADAVLLYLHGGAYALGTAAAGAGLAAEIARRVGARAVSVDYRLAPEHPHPAAVEDTVAAYRGLLAEGARPDRVVVAGESAGGGLAVAALVALRDAGVPLPAAAVLLSPWADLTLSGASMAGKAAADPALTATALRRRAADYVAGGDPAAPLVSPVFAELAGLPPLLVQAGSHEVLLDDAVRLAARAAAADVAVTLDVTPGVPHVFQSFAAVLDEGAAALDRVGVFLRNALAAAPGS